MTRQSKKIYIKLMNRIAIVLLLNQLMFAVLGTALPLLEDACVIFFGKSNMVDAAFRSLECVVYFISFTVPVLVFNKINNRAEREIYEPVEDDKGSLIQIFTVFGIALGAINLFAYVNYYIVNAFSDYSDFTQEVFWSVELDHTYQIVIYAIYSAVIPALVEELLFRGTICKALKVYGKRTAVIISAVLFALMHTNAEQLLYTFVAGLFLGWIYVESESLVFPVLLHFVNNGISVVEDVILEKCSPTVYNNVSYAVEMAIWILMVVCIVIYLVGILKKGKFINNLVLKPDENGEEVAPLSSQEKVSGFFTLGMIFFIIYSVSVMTVYIIMSFNAV